MRCVRHVRPGSQAQRFTRALRQARTQARAHSGTRALRYKLTQAPELPFMRALRRASTCARALSGPCAFRHARIQTRSHTRLLARAHLGTRAPGKLALMRAHTRRHAHSGTAPPGTRTLRHPRAPSNLPSCMRTPSNQPFACAPSDTHAFRHQRPQALAHSGTRALCPQ